MLDSTLPVIGSWQDKGYTDNIREDDSNTSVYTDRDMRAAMIYLFSKEVSDITVKMSIPDVDNNYDMNELESNEECQDYIMSEFVTSTATRFDDQEEVMEVSEETIEVGDDDIDMEVEPAEVKEKSESKLVQMRVEECWGIKLRSVGLPASEMKGKGKLPSMKKLPKKKSSSKKAKTGPGLGKYFKKTFETNLRFFQNLDAVKQSSMEVAKLQKLSGLTKQIIASGSKGKQTFLENLTHIRN
jgi:hypothetical protein